MIKSVKNPKHMEIKIAQAKKHGEDVCGDYFLSFRDGQKTYAVLCDGMGSGTKAYISAVMCANRILELMKANFDLKHIGHKIASFMKRARTETSFPFAAFCAVSISINGRFRAITYENPQPVLSEHTKVSKIAHSFSTDSGELLGLCSGMLEAGDTLFLMSDGITQAGLGEGMGMGWGTDGFLHFANDMLQQKRRVSDLLDTSLEKVCKMNAATHKDDATLVALSARRAKVINVLTGPPLNPVDDEKYIYDFLKLSGKKVICGSTTADIFSKVTRRIVIPQPVSNSFSSPPKYEVEGVELVTEGAATLNQAYNILDIDIKEYKEINAVTELCILLKEADTVNFLIGNKNNVGNAGLAFKQLGILPRGVIVDLIAKKLGAMDVQVNTIYY